MQDSLRRRCPGFNVQLGYLYDARSETVVNMSILNTQNFPKEKIQTTEIRYTGYEHTFNDSYKEKYEKLKVSAELKLEIMCKSINLSGSGAYLSDDKEHHKSIKGTVLIECKTVEEKINILNIRDLINFDALRNQNATHVIVGVSWGGNAIASFEYQNRESKKKQEIEGSFKAEFSKIKALSDLSANANVKYESKQSTVLNETNIKFKADMVCDEELPTNVEATLNLLKKFPRNLLQTNNGKGVPLAFELLSLREISRMFQIDIECDRVLRSINLEIISQIENEFDDLLEKKQKLNDLIDECVMNDKYLNPKNKKILLDLKKNILIKEIKFKGNISGILYQVKSGKSEINEISNQLLKFQQTDFSSKGVEQKLKSNEIQIIRNKIKFLKNVTDAKICIFENTMNDIKIFVNTNELRDKEVYIWKISDEFKNQDKQMYNDYYDYFLSLRRTENEAIFYLFDYDMYNNCGDKSLRIEHFKGGRKINEDCFVKKSEQGTVEMFSVDIPTQLVEKKREDELIHLMARCPNSNCPNKIIKWKCKMCDKLIEFDESSKFYCDCYSVDCSYFKFKCPSPKHPEGKFLEYSEDLDYFLFPQIFSRKSIIWESDDLDSAYFKQLMNDFKKKVITIDSFDELMVLLKCLRRKVTIILSKNKLYNKSPNHYNKLLNDENVLRIIVLAIDEEPEVIQRFIDLIKEESCSENLEFVVLTSNKMLIDLLNQ